MSSRSMIEEIRTVAGQYPVSRSAILPALRIAQERHGGWLPAEAFEEVGDRKSTRLNSSHTVISYAVFCLKKKKNDKNQIDASHTNSARNSTFNASRESPPLI